MTTGRLAPAARWAAATDALRRPIVRQAAIVALPFGAQQLIRLLTSVVLARLLAPDMLGIMVLINTLRTGVELLTDIGIGQSIVRSPHAHDRRFLDTAWTIQLARGAVLTAVALLAAGPLARAYDYPELASIVALVSLTFLIIGVQSPRLFVMQRDMRVARYATFEVVTTIGTSLITVALALWWGNVWALVWGLVLSFALNATLSYAFAPHRPRLAWSRDFGSEILHFGKWVFVSTAVYFAAMSTDRLYFSAVLPLALVGVYGVARTFAELGVALAQRLGNLLIFPKVAAMRDRPHELAVGYRRSRRLALAGIGAGFALALPLADQLVLLLYDPRYHAAAFMLPVLLAGVWFAVLAAFGEATLFGLDRPRTAAAGNAAKFAVLIVGLPLVVPTLGILAGLLVLAAAEVARWLALSVALSRERLAPLGDDLAMTALIAGVAIAGKLALGSLGLVPTFAQWWALGAGIHG